MKFCNYAINEICEMAGSVNLVCFGAGKQFYHFVQKYQNRNIQRYIHYIVDNAPDKIGQELQLGDRKIPIITVEDLRRVDHCFLIITCADLKGVFEQLQHYDEFCDLQWTAIPLIEAETFEQEEEKRWCPGNLRLTEKPRIPKKIHYCWFGKKPIPERNLRWMESWKKYCPDYEIIQWDESNYDVTKNDYMHEAYKAQKWGFVPDYARMDIIYQHGGIYLDTDVELLKPLDDLLYQTGFMGIDDSGYISLGQGFGACKGNRLLLKSLSLYDNLKFVDENGNLIMTPSTMLQKETFIQQGFEDNGEYQILQDVTIYPKKVMCPKNYKTGQIRLTKDTVSIHHYDGSWLEENTKNANHNRYSFVNKIMQS